MENTIKQSKKNRLQSKINSLLSHGGVTLLYNDKGRAYEFRGQLYIKNGIRGSKEIKNV